MRIFYRYIPPPREYWLKSGIDISSSIANTLLFIFNAILLRILSHCQSRYDVLLFEFKFPARKNPAWPNGVLSHDIGEGRWEIFAGFRPVGDFYIQLLRFTNHPLGVVMVFCFWRDGWSTI